MTNRKDGDERLEVVLIDLGPRKTTVIKLVMELLGLGLAEAKHFVETLPQVVARDLSMQEAFSLERRFQQADASVRLEDSGSP